MEDTGGLLSAHNIATKAEYCPVLKLKYKLLYVTFI